MSAEFKTKFLQIVDRAWNQGELDALDELHSDDWVEHRAISDTIGLDSFKEHIRGVRQSFPDFHLTISDLIVDGDRVATRWSWSGTHTKESPVFPMPPTGKKITVTGANIMHTKDGKLVEGWQCSDLLGMFRQMGIAPPMA